MVKDENLKAYIDSTFGGPEEAKMAVVSI